MGMIDGSTFSMKDFGREAFARFNVVSHHAAVNDFMGVQRAIVHNAVHGCQFHVAIPTLHVRYVRATVRVRSTRTLPWSNSNVACAIWLWEIAIHRHQCHGPIPMLRARCSCDGESNAMVQSQRCIVQNGRAAGASHRCQCHGPIPTLRVQYGRMRVPFTDTKCHGPIPTLRAV